MDIVRRGAATGVVLVVAYAGLFIVYGVTRYGLDLVANPPDMGLWSTWAIGSLSLFVATTTIALLMATVAALLGALTALLVAGLTVLLHAAQRPGYAAGIGLIVAGVMIWLVHLALLQMHLLSRASFSSATYLFWLGVPSLIYWLAAAGQTHQAARDSKRPPG